MRVSARELKDIHMVDGLIPEPLGGAHHNHQLTADNLKAALLINLAELKKIPINDLLEQRYQKYRLIGEYGTV